MNHEVNIAFSKKQIRLSLILGLAFLMLFLVSVIFADNEVLFFSNGIIALMHLTCYFYMSRRPLLTINRDFIKLNSFPPKKIMFSEIVEVKHFAGEYTIRNARSKIKIDMQFLDKEAATVVKGVFDPMLMTKAI